MFRSAGPLVAAAFAVLGLAAAGADRAAAQEGESFDWPRYFNVVTPIVGTANHSLGVAWTSEFTAQTGVRARVLPAPNGYARAQWLVTDEGRIAMLQASDYFDQMEAVEGFATPEGGPADTRVAHMNMVTPWGFMVRGDSDIESFEDVGPGTRIAYSPSSAFLVSGVEALLAYRDLDREDVELVEVGNYGANTRIVVEGRADVAFTSPLSGTSYEAAAGPSGIRWLELPEPDANPEAYDRYRALQPGYIAQDVVSGVESAKSLNMDHAYQANHVRAEEDPDFVYELQKWLDEHYEDFKDDFTHAPMMSIASMESFLEAGALQPLHEGAIRYLDEAGVWTDAYQERQDALVVLAEERVALFDEAVAAAQEQGLSTQPGNDEWHRFWEEYKAENGPEKSYGELVRELP